MKKAQWQRGKEIQDRLYEYGSLRKELSFQVRGTSGKTVEHNKGIFFLNLGYKRIEPDVAAKLIDDFCEKIYKEIESREIALNTEFDEL